MLVLVLVLVLVLALSQGGSLIHEGTHVYLVILLNSQLDDQVKIRAPASFGCWLLVTLPEMWGPYSHLFSGLLQRAVNKPTFGDHLVTIIDTKCSVLHTHALSLLFLYLLHESKIIDLIVTEVHMECLRRCELWKRIFGERNCG